MIQENQDRDLENRDQRRKNTMFKKGNIQRHSEIGDETRSRMRQGRGLDEDEARSRSR